MLDESRGVEAAPDLRALPMPIYEFSCAGCRKKVEIFRRSMTVTRPLVCPSCGGSDLSRLISRFAVHKTTSEFAGADDESYIEGLESGDPRAMAAWARRMGAESGEAAEPGFGDMVSRMEAGEMPDDDFGGDDAGDDDFGF
jgi:putative FmdB family regulatory protein